MEEKELILASYCLNYPVLYEQGMALNKPIALVFGEIGNAVTYANLLSPSPVIVDATMKVSQAKKEIQMANSKGVFVIMPEMNTSSAKFQEKMVAVFSVATSGLLEGKPCVTAIFLMFSKVVPEMYRDKVFEIHMDLLPNISRIDVMNKVIPKADELALVYDKMRLFEEEDAEDKALLSSTAFLYPQIIEESNYQIAIETAEKLCKDAVNYRDTDGIVELFSDLLYKLAEEAKLSPVYILPELDDEGVDDLRNGIYIKDDFIFVHEERFKIIASEIGKIITSNAIKSALLLNDIIYADSGGYTTKMSYCDMKGNFKRVRMMKFSMPAIMGETRLHFRDYLMEGI